MLKMIKKMICRFVGHNVLNVEHLDHVCKRCGQKFFKTNFEEDS